MEKEELILLGYQNKVKPIKERNDLMREQKHTYCKAVSYIKFWDIESHPQITQFKIKEQPFWHSHKMTKKI